MNHFIELNRGFQTAFVDHNINSNVAFRPEFLSNDRFRGKKVIVSLERELLNCEEFQISVAFITKSGITPLLQTLKELEKLGIPGRILTTDYLLFSEPDALDRLFSLKNIQLRMYHIGTETDGFHTKGYIFRKQEIYRMIIGSSNLTMSALTKNREWNTKLIGMKDGSLVSDILSEFEELWSAKQTMDYEEFIEAYRLAYTRQQVIREQQRAARSGNLIQIEKHTLKPNKMQVAFIDNLMRMKNSGANRALLISATGTGKTFASAFAMRELGFQRILFLVHRSQIAKQALKSFQRVFADSITMGLFTGKNRETEKDFLFATIQTMSRPENYQAFSPDDFDAIIYDEAHHAAAASYKRVMEYFAPKFSLGMTATPERRDDDLDGRNIYEIFDHQIAYEIRLQQAMEEELLCPFHYFGITDLDMISDEGTTKEERLNNFRYLTSDTRVDYIMQQAEYYGYSGSRVKGLIFCSRIDEAKELSKKLNEKGWRTSVLSGEDSEKQRSEIIERLTMEEEEATEQKMPLDYILSVDIFSEGVDIVEVNQVIMLRPTQSPVVFTQQLGRGLRKAEGKEFVVILDFIGNYKSNFMIPIALSGDRTYNKDNIRRYMLEGGRVIPGASTIHFDEISRKRIFQAIDHANFNDIRLIRENYTNLKNKLGRIPGLADFDRYGELDVLRIFDNKNLGSYYKFLVKYEKEYTVRLSEDEEKVIEFVSKKLANGKRVTELELLHRMLSYRYGLLNGLVTDMKKNYGKTLTKNEVKNLVNVMTNEFPSGSGKATYARCILIEKEDPEENSASGGLIRTAERWVNYAAELLEDNCDYRVSSAAQKMLENPDFCCILKELTEFGISRYRRDYSQNYKDTAFVLYQKYTYEDVCRLLNWEHNEVPLNIGGYKYDKDTQTFPVFINYDKSEDISASTNYRDHFISNNRLIAISKSGRSIHSEDVQNFLHAKEREIDVHLFVRKNKDDKISKEFYYLGRMAASGRVREFIMEGTEKSAVEIEWLLDTAVREDIYEYIVNS